MHHYTPLKTPAPARRPLFLRHPVTALLIGCPAAGAFFALIACIWMMISRQSYWLDTSNPDVNILDLLSECRSYILYGAVLLGCLMLFPIALSLIDLIGVFKKQTPENRRTFRIFAILTLLFGPLYSALYAFGIWDVLFSAEWNEQLYNIQRHQPVWTDGLPPVLLFTFIGIIGYTLLSVMKIRRMPPLLITLSIAAMYLGALPAALWCLQIGLPVLGIGQHDYASFSDLFMCLLPADCILLMAGLIRDKIHEWNDRPAEDGFVPLYESLLAQPATAAPPAEELANGRLFGASILRFRLLVRLDTWLSNSANWPLGGLLLALPLLGILLAILALFGQFPDKAVRAFTETADWGLSQKIPPQNAFMDEHYLCTVAAGGHRQIVRPMRYGERHGHRIVVNRQLLAANAFEQLLEERAPQFHRRLRHFYDTHGYPLSRLIRTKKAADITWLLMKPLEWLFIIALYLFDADPENRIAVQYLPADGRR